MPRTVKEIMNGELFSLRTHDAAAQALGYIVGLGITAAPVLDQDKKPVGMASFRDLLRLPTPATVAECMTSPALTLRSDAPVEEAARLLTERGVHRVVVVDSDGRAVGIASALDVIRGLLGLPALHPSAFPHWDSTRGVSWCDDTLLEVDRLDAAPDAPGAFALIRGGKGIEERVVWAEAAHNVRTRLYDLLARPQSEQPMLARLLESHSDLRFRAAAIARADRRESVAESLMGEARSALAPTRAE
jgi:hypothetical protein